MYTKGSLNDTRDGKVNIIILKLIVKPKNKTGILITALGWWNVSEVGLKVHLDGNDVNRMNGQFEIHILTGSDFLILYGAC